MLSSFKRCPTVCSWLVCWCIHCSIWLTMLYSRSLWTLLFHFSSSTICHYVSTEYLWVCLIFVFTSWKHNYTEFDRTRFFLKCTTSKLVTNSHDADCGKRERKNFQRLDDFLEYSSKKAVGNFNGILYTVFRISCAKIMKLMKRQAHRELTNTNLS